MNVAKYVFTPEIFTRFLALFHSVGAAAAFPASVIFSITQRMESGPKFCQQNFILSQNFMNLN